MIVNDIKINVKQKVRRRIRSMKSNFMVYSYQNGNAKRYNFGKNGLIKVIKN